MRILFLTSTLPRHAGDFQADFVGEQARAWLEARPGDEIVVLAPHHPGAPEFEDHGRLQIRRFAYLPVRRWQGLAYPAILPNIQRNPLIAGQLPFFLFAQYRAARRIVRECEIDLVYAHWVLPQGLVAQRLRQSCGVPFVLQNHSSDLAVFARAGTAGRRLARSLLREASCFFCVNADQLDFALSLFAEPEREAFARKALTLPMGLTMRDDGPSPAPRYDVATIGRLSRKKGLDLLIRAAELLATRGVVPRIGIAGDGEERTRLQALVGCANIDFTGFMSGADKARFFARSTRFAFPAKAADGDVEGMPVAMLEALARGAPVLASRDTNIELLPEWQAIREAVVFVEDPADIAALADGIERLLELDPARGSIAQEKVARYRWENLVEEYLAPIEAAVASV